MRDLFGNRWLWILAPAVLLFALLTTVFRVSPGDMLSWLSFITFVVVALAGKYLLRAPAHIVAGNVQEHAVNNVGWALVLTAVQGTQVYRWVFIQLGRPDQIALTTYWNTALVYLACFGFLLVAWSTRRTTPLVAPGPPVGWAGIFIGVMIGIGSMISGVLPKLWSMLTIFVGKLV